MPRPSSCRWISGTPGAVVFKPVGVPIHDLEEVVMSLDEFEAIRLSDREGLYQEEAAARMGVSRTTFGRILQSAHRKVAEVLAGGHCLRVEGGHVHTAEPGARPTASPRKETPVIVCVPVISDQGLESRVSSHFGSAPLFAVVDTRTGSVRTLPNARTSHEHGACRPLDAFVGQDVDAVVVGGIGPGAIAQLRAAGIRVFRAAAPTVAGCLDALERNELPEVDPAGACSGHGTGERRGGCHGAGPGPVLPARG